MKLTLIIVSIVLLNFFGICGCTKSKYNDLIESRENIHEKVGNLQAQYQRRYDLTAEIIRTIKSEKIVKHAILADLLMAQKCVRQMTATTDDPVRLEQAQLRLGTALEKMLLAAEADTRLGSNQAFQDLRSALEGSENRIKFSRTEYNAAVKTYNSSLLQFPNNLYAKSMGFKAIGYFQADSLANFIPTVALRQ